MRNLGWVGPAAAFVGVAWSTVGWFGPTRSSASPPPPAGSRAALGPRLLTAQARLDVLREEYGLLDKVDGGQPDVRLTASASLLEKVVSDELEKAYRDGLNALIREHGSPGAGNVAAEARREAEQAFHQALERQRAQAEQSRSSAARATAARAADWSLGGLLTLGVVLVAGGLLLTVHEGRHGVRRVLRAMVSRPGRMGLNAGLVLVLALALALVPRLVLAADAGLADTLGALAGRADELRRRLDELEAGAADDDLLTKVAQLERDVADAETRLDVLLARRRAAWVAFGLAPAKPEQVDRIGALTASAAQLEALDRDLATRFRAAELLAEEAARLDRLATAEQERLDRQTALTRDQRQRRGLTNLAACGALLAAVALPVSITRARRRRRLDEQRRMCPRCLEKDRLEPVTAADTPDQRRPKNTLFECSACKYEVRQGDLGRDRLCFPTVGLPSSGKTHWMVVLYNRIKNVNVQAAAEVRKATSREDDRFDLLVREVFHARGRPAPNRLNLPYPLNFHVIDADPFGRTGITVNLIDFAGELRELRVDLDQLRQRALLCEGFTFFLDPTQVTPGAGSDFDIEDQIQTLERFANDLRAMHEVPTERPLHLPVAVCISKIDLLVTKNPIGAQAREFVAELRATLGARPDLGLIQRRSQRCAMLLPLLFPGWNVEAALRQHFKGRFMFFPVSSIGLEDAELGIDEHASRTIAPFGVTEPLLWLLHMHGYRIFS